MINLPPELEFPKYPDFPKLPSVDVLLTWTDEQLQDWDIQAGDLEAFYRTLYAQHMRARDNWARILEAQGEKVKHGKIKDAYLESFYTWLRKLGYNPFGHKNPQDCWGYLKVNIPGKGPRRLDALVYGMGNPRTLFAAIKAAKKEITEQAARIERTKAMEAKLFSLSSSLGIEPGAYTSAGAFLDAVAEAAKTAFILKEYPDGTEIDAGGQCDYCDSWTVGDRRCSCGNRRMYLEVEGNVLDGFTAYPRAD